MLIFDGYWIHFLYLPVDNDAWFLHTKRDEFTQIKATVDKDFSSVNLLIENTGKCFVYRMTEIKVLENFRKSEGILVNPRKIF